MEHFSVARRLSSVAARAVALGALLLLGGCPGPDSDEVKANKAKDAEIKEIMRESERQQREEEDVRERAKQYARE